MSLKHLTNSVFNFVRLSSGGKGCSDRDDFFDKSNHPLDFVNIALSAMMTCVFKNSLHKGRGCVLFLKGNKEARIK
jgi:hypothetical protein